MRDDQTTTRTVAELIVESLQLNGIKTVFGVPGEETTDLMAAIKRSELEFVLCRHEQSAAFMASVHGRLTGNPAVCLATLGPGATNLVTGVADATLDFAPLIALTGQGARSRLDRESHQIIDLVALFEPVTKKSQGLTFADEVPGAVAEAIRLSKAEKPGAVHLSLPEDLAGETTFAQPQTVPDTPKQIASDADVKGVAIALAQAERPLILAGHGVIRSNASGEVRALAEHLCAPVLTTFMAKGVVDADSSLNLNVIGQPEPTLADQAAENADLILAIGFDPIEYAPEALTDNGTTPVVILSETAPEASQTWRVVAQAIGSLKASVTRIRQQVAVRSLDATFDKVKSELSSDLSRSITPQGASAFAPQDICRLISSALEEDDVVLSGVGLHKLWIAERLIPRRPGQFIIPNGLAGMGLALPGAIAAARLQTSGRTLAVCGDGDIMMNLHEMEPAARLGLPIVVMVWEDGGFGLIDEKQSEASASDRDFAFNNPNWGDLARAFDWTYIDIPMIEDLVPALDAAGRTAGPSLLRLSVDYGLAKGMPSNA
ncbi:MAG: thiamine pyrophosphate-binding protein [Paracoccaceae bacterium]